MRCGSADSIVARSGRTGCNKAGYKAANRSCHVSVRNPLQTGGVHINGAMNKTNKFSPEVRERAVRLVQEHRGEYPSLWAAVESIAPKIGCVPQTLLEWVKREDVDSGQRDGLSSSERERLKALEREVKELRRANEILKTASAFFAQAELATANSSGEGVHRPLPRCVRGRAHLQSLADGPVLLPTPRGAATQPGTALQTRPTR